MVIRLFSLLLLALLLVTSPSLRVVRCQSQTTSDEAAEVVEGNDLGIVGDEFQDFGDGSLSPAPGVDTACVFPKNAARLVPAGEETELLVGVNNEGESTLKVTAIRASLHLPFDHRMFVQNLTIQIWSLITWHIDDYSFSEYSIRRCSLIVYCLVKWPTQIILMESPKVFLGGCGSRFKEFYNASVPISAQATFPYIFATSQYLQPGSFDLVGTVFYEIDQQPYQSVFYNGTIEVLEAGGFLSIESVFLVTLGAALVGLFGLWAYGQIQHFSKKTKRTPKVEVGTTTTDADMDEWLQGTAYAESLSNKSKKKK